MTSYLRDLSAHLRLKRFNHDVEAMLPDLYKLACALTGTPTDAEDLVHDACVKALRSFTNADLPGRDASRAWVRSILVNTFRDRYRRDQRSPVRTGSQDFDNIIEFAESAEPTPEDWAVYDDLAAATRLAVAALPPEVRIVTTLYMVDHKSYKEIATIVDCPLGTVMSRLARGRRLLRDRLAEHTGDQPGTTSDSTVSTPATNGGEK